MIGCSIIILVIIIVVVIFYLLKCRNKSKKLDELNKKNNKNKEPMLRKESVKEQPTGDPIKVNKEDEESKKRDFIQEIKDKVGITDNELDGLFNNEYFDFNAAINLRNIVTHWQLGEKAVGGIRVFLSEECFNVKEINKTLAFLLNNVFVNAASETVLRFFWYVGQIASDNKLDKILDLFMKDDQEVLKGFKAFLYYVGSDNDRRQFLDNFFDAVVAFRTEEGKLDSFFGFLSKISKLSPDEETIISKRFFDTIKGNIPQAKEVFSKLGEKNFNFDILFSGLSDENFKVDNFLSNLGIVQI